jgi:hypothetical protein
MMLAILITAGVSAAYAQTAAIADVPFAFRVGSASFEPGKYELRPGDNLMTMMIVPVKGREAVASVITRLGEPEPPISEGRLVFDKVGDLSYLSEVWIPGSDGYLLHSTKEKHTHVKVKLTKKG